MADIIFNCPKCGHNLEVDEAGAGLTVPCPECSQPIQIPLHTGNDHHKNSFSCPHCKQSINYSLESTGQLIDCPGCQRTIEIGTSQPKPPPPAPHRQPAIPRRSPLQHNLAPSPQPQKKNSALMYVLAGAIALIGVVVVGAYIFMSDGQGKSIISKMLNCVKKGEDPGEYWINGSAKQKLYNVIDYEIMSSRPLNDALLPFYISVTNHLQDKIDECESTISDINSKVAKFKKDYPRYSQLGTIVVPDVSGDHRYESSLLEDVNRLGKVVIEACQYLPDSTVEELKQKVVDLGNAKYLSDGNLQLLSLKLALLLAVDGNQEAKDYIDSAPSEISAETNRINRYHNQMGELSRLRDERNGMAYKVKINSTNKAGQPIVWLWTITLLNTDDGWKISYLYDEEELSERLDGDALYSAVLAIYGE